MTSEYFNNRLMTTCSFHLHKKKYEKSLESYEESFKLILIGNETNHKI